MNARYTRVSSNEESTDRLSRSATPSSTSRQNGVKYVESSHLLHEIESLQGRLSTLSEASLRVSETLDVNTVLKEVIDNARDLTGARYGALLTYEPSGGIQEFITSGLSAEEIERMNVMPKGLGLLGYMNEIRGPLRLADISSHPSSVGFPENHPPMKTFLGMPIRHQGEYVGNIYLTEKEKGQEFTGEDQEILVMFASQAGAAIVNARRYRDEQKARADLEALVNISPVGVVVFDGKTGHLVSANDETRRIVGSLKATGRSLDHLLEVVSVRRVDGRQIPVEELPTTKALATGENVLADEVVIHTPEGRAITALVNARPIRGEDGEIVSVVATLQDITPLEEMKRQRAEFLNNVSHELRTPLTAIKGSTATVLSAPHALNPAETRQFLRVIDEQAGRMHRLINDLVDITQIEAGTLSVHPEPMEIEELLDQARDAHISLSGAEAGVEVHVAPDIPMVMADRRRILQVLDNLLASVSRYAPDSSAIRMRALVENAFVAVFVNVVSTDTGSSHPLDSRTRASDGFLRNQNGRDDLGLAVCQGIVEAHGGRLTVEGGNGPARRFSFSIPAVERAEESAQQDSGRPAAANELEAASARILVVADDQETARYIRSTLSGAGLTAALTCGSDQAGRVIESEKPHVILVEPNLPWDDGFELLQTIERISDAPVIFVAGHEWDQYIGRAFEFGAFDYVAKPFTTGELVARVDLAIRRRSLADRTVLEPYLQGELKVDYAERKVTVAGRQVRLTPTEFNLLAELSTAAGQVLTHEQLLRRVWGPLYSSDQRIVRTYVKEVRYKLGDDAARPTYIFTEPGVGYRMNRPTSDG